MKSELCRAWYLFLFGVCTIILATLDAILLLRGILHNYTSNKTIANLNWLEPVYALYRKDARVHILSIPIILQFIVASVLMEQVSRCHNFDQSCNKPTSLTDICLAGCAFWYPMYSVSVTLCSSRGSVVFAHTALLVAIFAKRNVAEGRAAVVRLVVYEGAWVVSHLSVSRLPFHFYVLFITY